MPRRPGVFVEGGIYHVYNRFASGEAVFADPEEARDFAELLRFVKKRDDWSIFAWSLMSNDNHLAIRNYGLSTSVYSFADAFGVLAPVGGGVSPVQGEHK
jgi:hypothetical protein